MAWSMHSRAREGNVPGVERGQGIGTTLEKGVVSYDLSEEMSWDFISVAFPKC
jgi:hypothetical protein